jgi:hypothetical protein
MRSLVRTGLVVLAWAVCVAGVAAVSWLAIDSAGRRVGVANLAGAHDTVPSVATSAGSESAGTVSPAPSVDGSAVPTSDRPGSGAESESESSRSTGASPGGGPVSDSIRTAGGVVELECTGAVISDFRVQPDTGWSARAEKEAPGKLEVDFRRDDRRIEVEGFCVTGAPLFELEAHEEHD